MKTNLSQLFMQAPVAICIVSGPQYIVELVNERMLLLLGRTSEIIGQPLQATLTEAKEQGLIAILEKVRTSGQPVSINNFHSVILINGIRESRYFNLIFKPYSINGEEEPSGIFCVAHNVTEAVLAHKNLEEEKQRTSLALETGELGMISTEWQNNIAIADKRANDIFGFEGPQPLEAYVNRIHPEDRSIRQKVVDEGVHTGNFDFEVRLLFPDGVIRWIRSRGVIQKNEQGKVIGSFGIVQDITAHKEFAQALQQQVVQRTAELEVANKSLQQANEDLLRSNSNLEEFARAASHDLKEPVRKMQVFASRLKETLGDRLSEEEKEVFNRMENAAGRMGLLVDDLLEYSRLNHVPEEFENIDLEEKLTRILSDLELLITEKNATIELNALPTVKGHRRQLQQLFQNLLINALKYSRPEVPPHIVVKWSSVNAESINGQFPTHLAQPDTNAEFHVIQVTDNGIGFHPEDAEKIFNVFTRLHGKDSYAGTGIGLSIAKKVVENHGGYIYATAQPGQGATFTVLLPAE